MTTAAAGPPSIHSYSLGDWLAHWRDALLWDPMATFTVALVLATVAVWLATRRLWLDGERQARVASRAYVGTEKMIVYKLPKSKTAPVEAYRFEVKWQNAGATPARRVCAITGYFAHDAPIPEDFPYDQSSEIYQFTVVPPMQSRRSYVDVPIDKLTSFERDLEFWVYSAIDYDDVFAGTARHRSEICFKVTFLGPIGDRNTRLDVQTVGDFNGSDEQCLFRPRPIERTG